MKVKYKLFYKNKHELFYCVIIIKTITIYINHLLLKVTKLIPPNVEKLHIVKLNYKC